jgi:hypothetical protein
LYEVPPAEGPVEGGVPAETRVLDKTEAQPNKKWKVTALQTSESQPLEVKRQKSSALPMGKSTNETEWEIASESLQEEILESPRESMAQPSQTKRKQTIEVPRKETSELQGHTVAQPSPAKETARPRKTREEKGKSKVGDSLQMALVVTSLSVVSEVANESIESPLSGIVSRGTELEVVEASLRENVEVEHTGEVPGDHFDDLPEALKRGFLSALTSTRKLLKKGWTVSQESPEAGFPGKVTIAEEHGSLVIAPLSDAPLFQVSTEAALPSDYDKETKRYIERILTDVVMETSLMVVSPELEEVGEPIESE